MSDRQNITYKTLYKGWVLRWIYDTQVLGLNMRFAWGCPTSTILLPFFGENFSRNHLDCGVATGYFPAVTLQRPFRINSPHHLTLLDLNTNSLNAARARAVAKATATEVRCVEADVTEPVPKSLEGVRFDSISMFNLFHCIPGGRSKLRAFTTFKHLLNDDGVLAGCTVLGPHAKTGIFTYLYLKLYNWFGIFNNWNDKVEDFQEALNREFAEAETWIIGQTLLFRALKPRRDVEWESMGEEE